MGKVQEQGRGKLTITYGGLESPMSGIDATHASGLYLNPTSLASAGGVISQDGYLNTVFMNPRALLFIPGATAPAYTIGDVATFSTTQANPFVVTKYSYGFVAYSSNNLLTIIEYINGFAAGFAVGSTYTYTIAANNATNLTWYAINGVVYITGLGLGAIYAYTPNINGTSTLTLLTNYVGGAYLGELNGRLICCCCDQVVSGVYSYFPYRVSWSAGGGAYGIWNPLVSGLVTGAGFNNLPDVADEIVGFFMVGPTGYVIRKQGITEMTPLNSGIQPFDFNHMWASQKGIGSVYPNTVAQYGSLGGFVSDIGVFTIGYGGINQIEGLAWAQINRELDLLFAQQGSYNQVLSAPNAAFLPLYINNERKLTYVIYIPTSDGYLFIGDVESKDWNIISCFTAAQSTNTSVQGVSSRAFIGSLIGSALSGVSYSDQTIACITGLFPNTGGTVGWNLYFYSLDDSLQTPASISGAPFLDNTPFGVFPIEEVAIYKDITVDAIAIVGDAAVAAGSTVNVTPVINGIVYSSVLFNGTPAQLLISYPSVVTSIQPVPMFTGKYPQLTIQMIMDSIATSSMRIYKIVLFCSYDQVQRP